MPENYFLNYLPLLIHFLFACGFAVAVVTLSWIIGVRKPTRAKMMPYECGVAPIGDAQGRFSVKFYLVAMLFILFDVEAVFIYPWAIILRQLKMFGFWEMLVYIAIFLVGFFYVWKKGALDWGGPSVRRGSV
jgi:NADH-quinone oxidoreductase subunit A